MHKLNKVLVLDGYTRHALPFIRSLGKKGIKIAVGSPNSKLLTITNYSKYCSEFFKYRNPETDKDGFLEDVLNHIKKSSYDAIFPLRDTSTNILAKHKDLVLKYTNLNLPDFKYYEIASSKKNTLEFVQKLNIPIPKTRFISSLNDLYIEKSKIKYPIVIKSPYKNQSVIYINSFEELEKQTKNIQEKPIILQEYIKGDGYGFFAIYDKGKVKAIFMHKRIKEYPITGGQSVVAESIYCERLKNMGITILNALNWHGVAMIEFKKDREDNEYKLMEINPKFWGSLDLSIVSGIDFPYLSYLLAINKEIEPISNYKIGITFRWLFPGELLHTLVNPSSIKTFLFGFFKKNVHYDIQFSYILPNLFQFFLIFGYLKLYKCKIKYPHGKPSNNS